MDKFTKLFSGRISRSTYFLSNVVIAIIALLISGFIIKPLNYTVYGFFVGLLTLVIYFLYAVSLEVRRWHDLGLSGWWTLTMVLLPLQWLLLIFLSVYPGNKGSNKYGKQPKSLYF